MKPSPATISVARLTSADIDEAFCLARLAFSDLTPGRWRRTARRWTASAHSTSGALLARDGAGRLVGIAPFVVRTDLCQGKTLWVERVAAFALIDSEPVVIALTDSLRATARALDCQRLKVETGAADDALRRALTHTPDSVRSTLIQSTV
ncbi:MAG: hypothetical protein Q7J28_09370 [Caulobacter sp.]|nr:hypothetical protein [Caulobacter sp.]